MKANNTHKGSRISYFNATERRTQATSATGIQNKWGHLPMNNFPTEAL